MASRAAVKNLQVVLEPVEKNGCHPVRAKPTIMTPSSTTSPPFNVETTLTFEAIEYWAKKDPHRTALISTEQQWKAEHGNLCEKHYVEDVKEWHTVTYQQFYEKVNRFRVALHHHGGVPVPAPGQKPYRILLLFAPSNRAEVLALLIALQAAGCVLLFGTPDAFGGIRNFFETMLKLEPDGVLCNRMVYTVFRSIAMTLSTSSSKVHWIKSSVLTKLAPKLDTELQLKQCTHKKNAITLDTVATIMFSSGTTGPPTPIEVSHRMLCFQAAGYALMLRKHLGQGIIKEHTTITGVIGEDYDNVILSKRDGPWISTHVFVNFVMLDLVLGGTAVMQPMGLSSPDKTVCANTLLTIWDHFQTQITSAPPALWTRLLKLKQQREAQSKTPLVESLQMIFIGGAETSASFAADLARDFVPNNKDNDNEEESSGLYRIYGTTQVLPIASASDIDIRRTEDTHEFCARGYGVSLGSIVDGLDAAIDTDVWERNGGRSQLATNGIYRNEKDGPAAFEMGELCVLGQAISPSMEKVGNSKDNNAEAPTRIFRSGDICYTEPTTRHIFFLGRMAQAVDCGSQLKRVPPVGVEMVCLETKTVQRCAFVGVPHPKTGAVSPTLVVQFDKHQDPTADNHHRHHKNAKASTMIAEKKADIEAACVAIRKALQRSVWSPMLSHCKISLVAYSKTWPVDSRHSSKTNRFLLRDWAAKLDSHKFHSV